MNTVKIRVENLKAGMKLRDGVIKTVSEVPGGRMEVEAAGPRWYSRVAMRKSAWIEVQE